MADDQDKIDELLRIVEERMGERERAVKAFEAQRQELRDAVIDVQAIVVSALNDAKLPSLANLVNARLKLIAHRLVPSDAILDVLRK